uniref:Putative secreted protein n=1 Tax=Amblyomma triste TaxID=251400 RepID=A0A023G5U1_AMBTT
MLYKLFLVCRNLVFQVWHIQKMMKLTFCFLLLCAWWTCSDAKIQFIPVESMDPSDLLPPKQDETTKEERVKKLLTNPDKPVSALWGNREDLMQGVTACWKSSFVYEQDGKIHHNLTFHDREQDKEKNNGQRVRFWPLNHLSVTYDVQGGRISVSTQVPVELPSGKTGEVSSKDSEPDSEMDEGQQMVSETITGTWRILGSDPNCFLAKLPQKHGKEPCLIWAQGSLNRASIPCLSWFNKNTEECPEKGIYLFSIYTVPCSN